ncbi:TPA: heme-binding protein [Vibrio cholerae]|uniref:GlcG/HbpS family heme-binding protein n=1 Tax=Vibrio cholerae TaxID=666 RepID=UPI001581453E|nr:heme-binding protein [Vibrio cholerae]EGQ7704527.1 heme-binding protein [Vibrio cholerae]EGR2446854.1 heme-binding protein [Vibrio cholerae]EGR4281082.1 heme-binding protein [Vibrio cholerae]EJL6983958.1 heme-binding protein [Vibrio cholerae]HDZ9234512.1 heme-binding protein [Vibrio cholerae]
MITSVKSIKSWLKPSLMICTFLLSQHLVASPLPLEKAPILTYEMAERAADSAFQAALKEAKSVSVSVVDRSGQLMASLRHHNAGVHTIQASYKKAYTANSTKQSTAVIANNIKEGKSPSDLRYLDDNILFLSGGAPIIIDGIVVGGIGVGGAQGHEDARYAQIGAESVLK